VFKHRNSPEPQSKYKKMDENIQDSLPSLSKKQINLKFSRNGGAS